MWVKVSMVRPSARALLLIERAYTESVQSAFWELGLECNRPGSQIWPDGTIAHGNPLLHSDPGQLTKSPVAKFNYLYCDNHVEFSAPRDTVYDPTTVWYPDNATYWIGGDNNWTILPYLYHNPGY